MCVNPFWRKTNISPFGKFTSKAIYRHEVGSDENGYYIYIPCPCGKCYECIQQNQKEWEFRLGVDDWNSSLPSWFITLTYDQPNLPVVYRLCDAYSGQVLVDDIYRLEEIASGIVMDCNSLHTSIYPVLHKPDVQKFFKRVRRKLQYYSKQNADIKYFLVGEYGGKYNRPHYHIALLNFDAHNFIAFCTFLRETWGKGIVKVERLTPGRIKYVAKYMAKVDIRPHEVNYFRTISKGIGLSYLTEENINYHRQNLTKDVHLCGRKYVLPKYLCDKIFTDEDKRKMFNLTIEDYFKNVFQDPNFYDKQYKRDIKAQDNSRILRNMFYHFVNSDRH